jgi:hypothetical protein
MARLEKLLGAMRRNPRADWYRAAEGDRGSIRHLLPATGHQPRDVSLAARGQADRARARPIKPVYVRQFLALLEALETANDD